LQRADIEVSDPPPAIPIPAHQAMLAELLERIIEHLDDATPLQPYCFDDTAWVGFRLGEMLPMNFSLKQKLLELDDPVERLEIVRQFLQDKGLLNPSK
jgi:Lon protease-like protein